MGDSGWRSKTLRWPSSFRLTRRLTKKTPFSFREGTVFFFENHRGYVIIEKNRDKRKGEKLLKKKRKVLIGTVLTASLAGAGVFRYFSDMAVCRRRPQIPALIQGVIDRGQDDDVFSPVVRSFCDGFKEIPVEEFTRVSADGLLLKGRLFRPEKPKRLVLFMHGWRSSWQKDFSVLVKPLLDMDCALFFADERAHGESEGNFITYGVMEKDDCVRWAQKLAKEFPELPLYLWGMSMGASAVMLASAEKELPSSVRGVISDCGFNNPREELEHLVRQKLGRGEKQIIGVYRRHFIRRCGFDLEGFHTEEALAKTKLPFLFFHGKDDHFVPTVMTLGNYAAAAGEKELVLIDGAVHCKCFYVDGETCFAKTAAFFKKYDGMEEGSRCSTK